MKKQPKELVGRDKIAAVQERHLELARGSSGYLVATGRQGEPPPDPDPSQPPNPEAT